MKEREGFCGLVIFPRKNPGPRLPLGMKSEAVCMGICIYVLYFSSSFVQMAEITTHLHTAHLQMKTVHNQRTRRIPVVLHSPHNRWPVTHITTVRTWAISVVSCVCMHKRYHTRTICNILLISVNHTTRWSKLILQTFAFLQKVHIYVCFVFECYVSKFEITAISRRCSLIFVLDKLKDRHISQPSYWIWYRQNCSQFIYNVVQAKSSKTAKK